MVPQQTAAQASAQAQPQAQAQRYFCTPCQKVFDTESLLQAHKMKSSRHILCDVCSMEFKNEEARKSHRNAHHSAEQDLNCPYCGKHFSRMGGLVSHWELTECHGLPASVFDQQRKDATERLEQGRAANRFKDISRSGKVENEPLPPMRRQVPVFQQTPVGQRVAQVPVDSGVLGNNGGGNGSPVGGYDTSNDYGTPLVDIGPSIDPEEDLISFTTAVLNTPWGLDPKEALVNVQKFAPTTSDFPALGKPAAGTSAGFNPATGLMNRNSVRAQAYDTAQTSARLPTVYSGNPSPQPSPASTNAWSKQKNLFPEAPAAIAPPTELLKSMAISEPVKKDKNFIETHPDSPDFRADRFWIKPLGKFKCPHCPKSHASRFAFIAHLKSPAHRSERLQCTKCLRYYDTATALTQHYESQGVRCTVRETDGYDNVLLGATAENVLTQGRMADDTIKYIINPQAPLLTGAAAGGGVAGVAAAFRAAERVRNNQKDEFWTNNTPKW
ncbi:hypothetical protein LZ554_003492 [Drepanopeziza brunnea f. sp. 'monogermtubi']|nr:hypothetical protein LZ554_003492 [Drepanopeziza brunnea f. sp. 'monogermtubi']